MLSVLCTVWAKALQYRSGSEQVNHHLKHVLVNIPVHKVIFVKEFVIFSAETTEKESWDPFKFLFEREALDTG